MKLFNITTKRFGTVPKYELNYKIYDAIDEDDNICSNNINNNVDMCVC